MGHLACRLPWLSLLLATLSTISVKRDSDVPSSIEDSSSGEPARFALDSLFPSEAEWDKTEETQHPFARNTFSARRAWTSVRIAIVTLSAIAAVEFFLLVKGYVRQSATLRAAHDRPVTTASTGAGVSGTTPAPSASAAFAESERPGILSTASAASAASAEAPASPEAATPAAPAAAMGRTPPANPANAVGWLSVDSPVEVQLFEDGGLIGSNQSRIMLPVGQHVLSAVNNTLGYKEILTAEVTAGAPATISLQMPVAPVNINAVPWAEVSVDGNGLGSTPLANVSLSIGRHEIVFVHPQLGERRQTVTIGLSGANRVSANLAQP